MKKWSIIFVAFMFLVLAGSNAWGAEEEGNLLHQMTVLVLGLAFILFAAKIGAEVFDRFLKLPSVLGELVAGIIIGPYLLGQYSWPFVGHLFAAHEGTIPISPELYGIATVASVVLLFMVGLETDFKQFLRYSFSGALVGIGGVLGPFILGAWITVAFGIADSFMDPTALFMGAISTATSVGITARVLSEKKSLDTPEGSTILAGAIIDDVLGILVLAVVVGLAAASGGGGGGSVNWGEIGIIALKAFGFWIGATVILVLISPWVSRFLKWFIRPGATLGLSLGLALLLAGIAEKLGLAMIIGAYIMGFSLSRERIAEELQRHIEPVYEFTVPIFFVVMGMLVDFKAMIPALGFGIIYCLLAIVAKVIGGGLPALLAGFNPIGASRIGIGMLPRGEVALIIAGVGIATGVIGSDMFGVSILMTLVTTIIAPPILVKLFSIPRSGLKKMADKAEEAQLVKVFSIDNLTWTIRDFFVVNLAEAFRDEDFEMHLMAAGPDMYHIIKDGQVEFEVKEEENGVGVYARQATLDGALIRKIVDKGLAEADRRMKNATYDYIGI